MTRSAKLEQLWAAPPLYRIVILLYCTPDLTSAVHRRVPEPRIWRGASDVGGIFDVANFQQGFPYIVPGTEYRVLNLVL